MAGIAANGWRGQEGGAALYHESRISINLPIEAQAGNCGIQIAPSCCLSAEFGALSQPDFAGKVSPQNYRHQGDLQQ
jgi:hypothetical protein